MTTFPCNLCAAYYAMGYPSCGNCGNTLPVAVTGQTPDGCHSPRERALGLRVGLAMALVVSSGGP